MATQLPTTINSSTPAERPRRRRWTPGAIVSLVVLCVVALAFLTPFVFMISTSLNYNARTAIPFPPQVIPSQISGFAYQVAAETMNLWRLYANSFEVTIVEILFSLGSALLAGYSLSKIRPWGSRVILFVAVSTMMIPVEAVIIPNFLTFDRLHLLNTYWPLWVPAISYPYGTFLTKQYLDGVPDELRDAAKIDGAGELRIFWSIYLPLCNAVAATLGILLFVTVWNDYLWPLIVLTNPDTFTMQLGISVFSQESGGATYTLPSANMAATCLSIIPVVVVFLALQRYVLGGGTSWGLKA